MKWTEYNTENFIERFDEVRIERELGTECAIAHRAEVNQAFFTELRNGSRKFENSRISTVLKVLNAMDVSVPFFFSDTDDEPEIAVMIDKIRRMKPSERKIADVMIDGIMKNEDQFV